MCDNFGRILSPRNPPGGAAAERRAAQEAEVRDQHGQKQVFPHHLFRSREGTSNRRLYANVELREAQWRLICCTEYLQVGPVF